jgi:hypothetical protein
MARARRTRIVPRLTTVLAATLTATALAAGPEIVVGHIGETEVRATDIIERCAPELAGLEGLPDDTFRARARRVLLQEIQGLLVETMIRQDAETALTADERAERAAWLEKLRADLTDRLGGGDEAQTERLLRARGTSLDEHLEELWVRAIIQRRFQTLFAERLAVSPDEIRRAYERRRDRYHPPALWNIRMLVTADDGAADRIDAAFAAGTTFDALAARADGRTVRVIERDVVRGALAEPLDAALRDLTPGTWSSRVQHGARAHWIRLDGVEHAAAVPLAEAAAEIEADLRAERARDAQTEHIETLLSRIEHTAPDEMLRSTWLVVRAARADAG